jgi:hypothetical protein
VTGQEMVDWIDNASYEELLRRWRFGPMGDEIFQSKMGEYYQAKLEERRQEVGDEVAAKVSKLVGWGS